MKAHRLPKPVGDINVLSLFDGMSCGQIALNRAGIKVNKYYASEIDKPAITVTQHNYPNTIQLGDVTKWREWDIDWSNIDLLIGGSPCQGFSFAGKQLNFDDHRSKLFFVFVDILNHIKQHNPNVKFLLENVRMKQEYENTITDTLGVYPVFINSSLVSAANRPRLYWVNWKVTPPKDKGITFDDIAEKCDAYLPSMYIDKVLKWNAHRNPVIHAVKLGHKEKLPTLLARGHNQSHREMILINNGGISLYDRY